MLSRLADRVLYNLDMGRKVQIVFRVHAMGVLAMFVGVTLRSVDQARLASRLSTRVAVFPLVLPVQQTIIMLVAVSK